MANRIFVIPRRTDFPGLNIAIWDLWPNNPQKNNNLDGSGQTFYMGSCLDLPGSTTRNGDAYVSGSTNTSLVAADAVTNMDTTGGGANVDATQTACFGLGAYIRERCMDGVTSATLSVANAMTMAASIRTAADGGAALTNTAIDALLNAVVAGTRIDANFSFGTVEDVLRILSGEVYVSPRYVITATNAHAWRTDAQRNTLVAAQITGITGLTFVSHGSFLTTSENGYRGRPILARTGEANVSMAEGHLHFWSHSRTFTNPAFAYAAADVTWDHPRASDLAGNAIPSSGAGEGLRVYLNTGTCLL
jgi:hypothetical protein